MACYTHRRVLHSTPIMCVGAAALSVALSTAVHADPQTREEHRRGRANPAGEIQREASNTLPGQTAEAPTGFDNLTNGYDPQDCGRATD